MTDRLPHEKGFHVSWDQLHRDSRALAWRLDGKGPDDGAWKAVVAITRGGMSDRSIPTRILPVSMPSPRVKSRPMISSRRSVRIRGSSSRGIWRCNMCSPIAGRTKPCPR